MGRIISTNFIYSKFKNDETYFWLDNNTSLENLNKVLNFYNFQKIKEIDDYQIFLTQRHLDYYYLIINDKKDEHFFFTISQDKSKFAIASIRLNVIDYFRWFYNSKDFLNILHENKIYY